MKQVLNSQGISLVEVMVAMVISGIALMGTLGAVEISLPDTPADGVEQSGVRSWRRGGWK